MEREGRVSQDSLPFEDFGSRLTKNAEGDVQYSGVNFPRPKLGCMLVKFRFIPAARLLFRQLLPVHFYRKNTVIEMELCLSLGEEF